MKSHILAGTALLLISATGSAAQAADLGVQFIAGVATDNMFRGVSQTMENPQVYGEADLSIGEIGYAGIWASNVDYGDGTDAEVDFYGGIRPTIGALNFDIGVIYATYWDQPPGAHENYWELKLAASTAVGPATVGASVNYSPEFYGKTGNAAYYEANASLPVKGTPFSFSAALGHQWVEESISYTTWNAGVSYQLNEKMLLDVRYVDTAKDKFGEISKARVVAGLKFTF